MPQSAALFQPPGEISGLRRRQPVGRGVRKTLGSRNEHLIMLRMSLMLCVFAASILLVVNPSSLLAQPNLAVYKNAQHRFSFSYPSTWVESPTRTSSTIVKVVSNNGYGDESCNVVVHRVPALKHVPTSKAIRSTSPKDFVELYEAQGLRNVRVRSSGETHVVAREALFVELSYEIPMLDDTYPIRILLLVTTESDVVYTISCGTSNPSDFEELLPLFRFITGTLTIL